MAGFTGFPFPNKTFPSSSSTPVNPLFGSSSSSNGFSSTNNTQVNDEATIKKILEAIEILEKLANNGGFPKEKLQEIKKEVEKMYPNIFSAQNPSNNDSTPPNNNTSSFQGWENYLNNNNAFSSNLLNQQQEFYNNYQRLIQQQVNYQIQAQNQMMEQYMKMFATTTTPNYYYPVPSYNGNNNGSNMSGDVIKIALEMMGKSGNDGLYNNLLGNNTSFGGDGFGALSFLGNLLGGFGF